MKSAVLSRTSDGFIRFTFWFGIAGVIIPIAIELTQRSLSHLAPFNIPFSQYSILLTRLTLCLWPSSIILICGCGGIGLVATSIALNVVIYIVLGVMLWFGLAKHRAFLPVPFLLIAGIWWRLLTL